MILPSVLLTAALGTTTALAQSEQTSWPHIRGPQCDGRTPAPGLFEGGVQLELAWKVPLGPSYSGIAIGSDSVVTCFSDGESDFVIAFDADAGTEHWRYRLGETYRGHDGSEDGPISSPVVYNWRVFAIGAHGQLVALDLASGEVSWKTDLATDFGAPAPDYGFTTSPVVAEGTLVVQTGGSEGRSITGFDPASGDVRWSLEGDSVQYQSPIAVELAGRSQVLVLDTKRMLGLDPGDGSILWEYALEGERDSANSGFATPLGGDRFGVNVGGGFLVMQASERDGELSVEPLFRSRELGRSYAAPVAHGNHIYGFKSDFLTCIDGNTGKRVWKSRPPGGRGLILVEDRLVVFGAEGVAAIVKATPEGYVEEARYQALDHTGYTWPSYCNGRILLRNSSELASIAIVRDEGTGALAEATPSMDESSAFAAFVARAEASGDPGAQIEAFMEDQESFPIFEGNRMHVVFRGDVEDVAVMGTMTEGTRPEPMNRVAGSDFYYASFDIEPGARWEYGFQVDFEEQRADPLNPRTVPGRRGELSEAVSSSYPTVTHLGEPADGRRGRLESYEFASEQLGTTRPVQVYLPPGYDEGEASYPLLVVHQGSDWVEKGLLPNTLDNLIGTTIEPVVVVFIDPIRQWWFEGGGSGTEEYLDMLATEFMADLAARYRISESPADRALMGNHSFAMTAVLGALRHPEVFGGAAVQSVFLGDVARHALLEHIESGPKVEARFYIDWNRYGARNLDSGHDYAADSARLAAALEKKGYAVAGGEAVDSHGWGSWRARTDQILATFFGS